MELIFPIIFAITPIDVSCYRVIDSPNIQEFFSSVSNILSCNKEKTVELNIYIYIHIYIPKVSKLCVMRLTQNKKNQ